MGLESLFNMDPNAMQYLSQYNNMDKNSIQVNPTGGLSSLTDMLGYGKPTQDTGFGLKDLGGFKGLTSILSGVGGLYNSFMFNKNQNKQLDLQKQQYDTNIKNQTKAYNTNLEDRIRTRYNIEGRSQNELNNYLQSNKI